MYSSLAIEAVSKVALACIMIASLVFTTIRWRLISCSRLEESKVISQSPSFTTVPSGITSMIDVAGPVPPERLRISHRISTLLELSTSPCSKTTWSYGPSITSFNSGILLTSSPFCRVKKIAAKTTIAIKAIAPTTKKVVEAVRDLRWRTNSGRLEAKRRNMVTSSKWRLA